MSYVGALACSGCFSVKFTRIFTLFLVGLRQPNVVGFPKWLIVIIFRILLVMPKCLD